MKKITANALIAMFLGMLSCTAFIMLINQHKFNRHSKQDIEAIQILYYTHGFRDGKKTDTLRLSPEKMQAILDNAIITTNSRYSNPEIGGSK